TIERDGWRFEPVPDSTVKMRCRGQVSPRSRRLVYEVFVRELSAGPQPTLVADLLCTVDGLKAFHASSVGLALVPDWPLGQWGRLGPPAIQETGDAVRPEKPGGLAGHQDAGPVARLHAGLPLDYPSLLACAWGTPS